MPIYFLSLARLRSWDPQVIINQAVMDAGKERGGDFRMPVAGVAPPK